MMTWSHRNVVLNFFRLFLSLDFLIIFLSFVFIYFYQLNEELDKRKENIF